MGYSIVDLLDKLIIIEQNACRIYRNIAAMGNNSSAALKTAARVLAKEEERHIGFYQGIKQEVSMYEDTGIDFDIYDKASSLVQEFKNFISKPYANDARELIRFALILEKENVALLLNIQGRLVKSSEDTEKINYLTLSDLIIEEKKHVENLQLFINE